MIVFDTKGGLIEIKREDFVTNSAFYAKLILIKLNKTLRSDQLSPQDLIQKITE